MDEDIDKVRELEEGNYQKVRLYLKGSDALVQELLNLYKLLATIIEKSGLGARDEIVCSADFLLACQYQLTMAALSLLRGHLTDPHLFSRKAIEFCAFALRIKKHPHLATVWLQAGDDDPSYEKYRDKFRPGKLYPEDHELLGELGKRYDLCSKLSHPSIYSICQHIKVESTESNIKTNFNYFELKKEDPSEPIHTFLWLVDTHFGIIRVFEEALTDVIVTDRAKWEVQRNAVETKISLQRSKWGY